MAGVKASYDNQHSSGPEESSSSYYVKVTLKDGHHVTCKLHAENAGNLPRCINCYFFITSWVRLVCRHSVCIECFKNSMTFVCPADSTLTFKYQSHIEKEHPVTQRKSRTARELVQEPTEICGNNEPRNLIPNGYKGRDPESSNTGPSKLHEGVADTKTDNPDTLCKDERQNCNFTGFVGRGQEFQKNEQSDLLPTAIESEETHYKTCVVKMAKCPLCQKEVNKKALAAHISSVCEHRLVNCPYCGMEVEDRHLKNHMQDCDERPATCPHCAEEFDTFAELRDERLLTCRSKPTKCPYARVGCNFQATANMMEKHAASCQHLSSLIDRVLHLEAELQDVKSALEEAKKDKEQLKQLIADKEDEYHKTDEYLRKNLQEDIDEVRTQVQKVERDYKTSESDLRARFQALEQRNTFLDEPIGKLLAEMATMN
ncbi:uncharacterized protein LOC142768816 isoform X2 [Rhipicephalus microplus]|uniref:uncharacterized protein LOC142768816 isoform X2 n=1 Tax=Rhipicephalus microplus TaxID=6941 RepID=UPI003F6B4D47